MYDKLYIEARIPSSNIIKKRTTKSKERKSKQNKDNGAINFDIRKMSINRPFSGDPSNPNKLQKGQVKFGSSKVRPKTAKKPEKEFKSPGSRRLLSPKTNKKPQRKSKTRHNKASKTGKKGPSLKNNRKASMSPTNEVPKDLLSNPSSKPGKASKATFGNRRSMNDLRGKYRISSYHFI